jgi:hypothetical protein
MIGGHYSPTAMPIAHQPSSNHWAPADLQDQVLRNLGLKPTPARSQATAEDLARAIRGVQFFRSRGVLNDREAELLTAYMIRNYAESHLAAGLAGAPLLGSPLNLSGVSNAR